MTIRLLIADPQPLFCEALADELEHARLLVVASATSERDAARLASAESPDVVLTEIGLSPGSGLELARRLRGHVRVLILTRRHPGEVLLDAVAAGASGCLSHELAPLELATHVRQAESEEFVLERGRLHGILARASESRGGREGSQIPTARLTEREREVFGLMARGLDNAAIGRELYLSPHTVRTHVGNILRKLEVHSRAEAVRIALDTPSEAERAEVLRLTGPELEVS